MLGENESSRRIKTEFLVQMQGVGKANTGVLVLGATNTPWELDPAVRRRFEKRVYISLPEEQARLRILKLSLGDTPNSITEDEWKILAKKTECFSGADISVLAKEALYEPVRVAQVATHFKKVKDPTGTYDCLYEPCSSGEKNAIEMTLYDVPSGQLQPIPVSMRAFQQALLNAKPTVGQNDLQRFEDWTKTYGQDG
jgi:vacuolar protein-sorting-associated protein 4